VSGDVRALLIDLVDHLDAMVAYWDDRQICRFANAAYREWFGKDRQELIGTTLASLLGPLYDKNRPYIEAAYAGAKQVFERDIPIPGGGVRPSLATYIPHVVDGEVRGIFAHVVDVGPLKRLERELLEAKERAERLATHDFLTGLPNRTLLSRAVDQAIALAQRSGGTLAVMSVDVDRFKAVNDTWGHGAGDRLLIEIAARLDGAVRASDTVLRIGGDEFVIVTTAMAGVAEVEALAARILASTREPVTIGTEAVNAGVSIGISLYPGHGMTAAALVAASDQALYAAKNAGRDCYVVAG
jgi:diguanylate cyclase (GGDEF)-like protein/PAS domain S-box-containing protein